MKSRSITERITDSLLDDDFRQSFLVLLSSAIFSLISFVSAIIHFVSYANGNEIIIMAIVLSVVFACSMAVFLLTFFVRKYHHIWRRIFMVLVIILFGYCCWDGGPDGFIHLWIFVVPAFSFIMFGIYEGFVTAIPTLVIMLLFLLPLNNYTKNILIDNGTPLSLDFKLRMILTYLVGLLMGFIAELLRRIAAKRLKIFNKQYEYASLHDSLTDCANQSFLAKYLKNIYDNKESDNYQTLGCLFVDVDGFKNVNDVYGHLFGNTVLIKIAEILNTEKNAFVCRWGGDEFVICMTNIDEERLVRIGEKYRATVSAYSFDNMPKFHITVSIGAVVIKVDESFDFDHVLELADSANRTAKAKAKIKPRLKRSKDMSTIFPTDTAFRRRWLK